MRLRVGERGEGVFGACVYRYYMVYLCVCV